MFDLKVAVKATKLAELLNLDYHGSENFEFSNVSPLNNMSKNTLTFSNMALCDESDEVVYFSSEISKANNVIVTENPRTSFIKALELLDKIIGFKKRTEKAIIHPSVIIGQNVVIESDVTIGEGTVIEPNVTIFSGTHIGKNCIIRSNSSIGSSGFGFEREPCGKAIKFIHLGGVSIGDDVEVGSCTCIAKGTLGNTIIEDGVKIDNLVHVAHNCIIRKNAFLIACSEISGGVTIGESAWIAPNASITQKVSVGDGALVGLGAVITKDVPERVVVAGNPGKQLRKL